jgi:hypothetical protein
MPGMPWIAYVSQFANMGVLLLTCIMGRGIIKAKKTFCCFQRLSNGWVLAKAKYAARSDWAAC